MNKGLTPVQEQVLKALCLSEDSEQWATAPIITKTGRSHVMDLNPTSVYRILSKLRQLVEYRTIKGVRRFHLKEAGRKIISNSPKSGAVFIKPGTPWSSLKNLKIFLTENSKGHLLLVDPYVAEETLDVIEDVVVPVKILCTQPGRVGRESNFLRYYKKFRKEKSGKVEIRTTSQKNLHGRYFFTNNMGFVVDHSIQDFGTKPALIIPLQLEKVYTDVYDHFNGIFESSTPLQ